MTPGARRFVFLLALLTTAAKADFLDENPSLKKHIYREPRSSFWIGAGVGPVGFLENRAIHSLSAFQLHWNPGLLDWEIINVSLGLTSFAKESFTKARHFFFRSSPKLKIFGFLSFGPLIGYEFVSFPEIATKITKGGFQTPQFEPFSSRGAIYGVEVTQSFPFGESYQIRIAEVFYRQSYSTTVTSEGWDYLYDKPEIQNDPNRTLIKPSYVFLLEFSFLF